MMQPCHDDGRGAQLAARLGLVLPKRQGHDFAGPCIACESSDAFRLHTQSGVAQCNSCGGKWSPYQLAEAVTRDREQAKRFLVEVGIFEPRDDGNGQAATGDPIACIARQKGITAEALRAFGAKPTSPTTLE